MKNILVLGANGFIGSHLVNRLLQNHYVIGYDAFPSILDTNTTRYRHICGNYCEERNFDKIILENDASIIYHLISTTTPKEGTAHIEQEIQQNYLPTIRLLEAAAQCGVQRVIFPSSGGTVYGEYENSPHYEDEQLSPICSYGIQKAVIEAYLRLYHHMHGLDYLIARISNPYGCCMQQGRTQGIIPLFLRALQNKESIMLYGNTQRDYIYIDDVIDALVRMVSYSGKEHVFNVASGQGTFLFDLIALIEKITGQTFQAVYHKELRKCDVQCNILDIEKTKKELHWLPQINLDKGIQKSLEEMGLHF